MNKYILIILLLFGSLGLSAQQSLSLEQCRQMALKESKNIEIATLQIEKAKAEKAAMRANYFPSLSGSATGLYLHNNIEMDLYLPTLTPNLTTGELDPNIAINPMTGAPIIGADGNPIFNMYAWLPLEISIQGAYIAGVTIEQPLYVGGKIRTGNRMTQIGVGMAEENLALQRDKTFYETDQSYWLYVTVQEKVKLAQKYNKLLNELLTRTQNAYETGMTTQNDVLKVKVKQNQAKLQLLKAQSGLQLTRMALCRATGLPFDTEIITTDSLTQQMDNELILSENNISLRPEYGLMQKQIELANEQVKLIRADFLPTAGLQLGYNYVGGIEISKQDFNQGNASVIASVKIPLFHWGEGKNKIKSAQTDTEIKKAEFAQNLRLIELEITQARLNYNDAQIRIGLCQENLQQAEENLRVTNNNYELGMKIITELIEAQTQWQEAYSEVIDARADCKIKESAYLKASSQLTFE